MLDAPETAAGEDSTLGPSCRHKIERNRVHTVASILWGEALSEEDVAKVSAASGTSDFRPYTILIGLSFHPAGYLVVEARPTAPGLEFVVEDTGDGIKLKPMTPYSETRAEDLLGCVGYKGPKKSLKEMEAAIAKGAGKRL